MKHKYIDGEFLLEQLRKDIEPPLNEYDKYDEGWTDGVKHAMKKLVVMLEADGE